MVRVDERAGAAPLVLLRPGEVPDMLQPRDHLHDAVDGDRRAGKHQHVQHHLSPFRLVQVIQRHEKQQRIDQQAHHFAAGCVLDIRLHVVKQRVPKKEQKTPADRRKKQAIVARLKPRAGHPEQARGSHQPFHHHELQRPDCPGVQCRIDERSQYQPNNAPLAIAVQRPPVHKTGGLMGRRQFVNGGDQCFFPGSGRWVAKKRSIIDWQ